MKKILLFSVLSILTESGLFAQPKWQNHIFDFNKYASVYFTGTKIEWGQNEIETIEKMAIGGTIQMIILRKGHLGIPSGFFPDMNEKVAVGDSGIIVLHHILATEIRSLFREFLLSIALFNSLIEKQLISGSNTISNLTLRDKNTPVEINLKNYTAIR